MRIAAGDQVAVGSEGLGVLPLDAVQDGDGVGLLSYLGGPIEMLAGEQIAIFAQALLPLGIYVALVSEPLRDATRALAARRSSDIATGRRRTAG